MTHKRTPSKKTTPKPGEIPAKIPVVMRPAKNGGFLRVGGTNKGGPGRPRDAVRQTMLTALDKALPRLIALAESPDPAIAIKATEMLAKYGLGTSNELDSRVKDERVLTREERADRALTLLKGSKTA